MANTVVPKKSIKGTISSNGSIKASAASRGTITAETGRGNPPTSYVTLRDKPYINGTELIGNRSLEEIGVERITNSMIEEIFKD